MSSSIMSGFRKIFTKDRVMILTVFLLFSFFLLYYSSEKNTIMDSMHSGQHIQNNMDSQADAKMPIEVPSSSPAGGSYAVHEVVNPSELLPKDDNSQWAALNPSIQKNGQAMPDLLQAGYHISIGQVTQTLRNANLQLRSDPVIPKREVGPWNQSTLEPDILRQPLEIGDGCNP